MLGFCGPLAFYTRDDPVPGHAHHHDHVTIVHAGWFAILTKDGGAAGRLTQLAAEEFLPRAGDPIPVRFPDRVSEGGLPELDIRFIDPGEPIPADAERLPFAPEGDHMNIPARVQHHLVKLSRRGRYRCWYARRNNDVEAYS